METGSGKRQRPIKKNGRGFVVRQVDLKSLKKTDSKCSKF